MNNTLILLRKFKAGWCNLTKAINSPADSGLKSELQYFLLFQQAGPGSPGQCHTSFSHSSNIQRRLLISGNELTLMI